jgi:small-conductance mechanosensitive channel
MSTPTTPRVPHPLSAPRLVTRLPLLALLLAVFAATPSPAAAQSPFTAALTAPKPAPPPAAAAPAHPATAKLTPAEAQAVLDVLNDPQKRAAFTATLQSMLKATAPAAAAATAPAAPAAVAVPLAPNSIGAQLISHSEEWLSELGEQATAFGHVLGNLPAVWAFTRRTLESPESRDRVIQAAWHLGLVLLVAIAVEWIFARALKRPIASLAAHAPESASHHTNLAVLAHPPPLAADADDEVHEETLQRHRRFSRTLRLLKRLPFMLMRLILDLLPVATFLGLGYAGMNFTQEPTAAVLLVAIIAYTASRTIMVATKAITSPDHRSLRVVHLSDQGAAYAVVWVRRLVAVAALGYAAGAIGAQFGLPHPARLALMKTMALLDHVFLVIIVLQCRRSVADHIRGQAASGISGRVRRRFAAIWHLIAIFFIGALWVVWAAQVRNGYGRLWRVSAVTFAILVVARIAAIVLLGALDRIFRIAPETALKYPGLEARANRYYPLLRGTLSTLLVVITCLVVLQAWGVNTLAWFRTGALGGQVFSAVITVLIAGAVALAVWEGTNASLERHLSRLMREAQMVRSARLRTLMPILRTVLLIALIAIFGLTTLSEIGVNIAPLLAGAGILGVAIGFGSQKLVQDFITGIFLLLENAMQVGDFVTVAGLAGSVENLSIRTMRLRAGDGSVHIIPFSSVTTVTNANRGIGNAAVSVNVPIEEDTDHVSDVLADIARDMRQERRFADMMRSDLQLWGVDKVDSGIVSIVGQIVCTDGGRWAVQREFNRRLNIRFKELGIQIATPRQTVFSHEVPPPENKQLGEEQSPPPAETVQESPPPSALGHGG